MLFTAQTENKSTKSIESQTQENWTALRRDENEKTTEERDSKEDPGDDAKKLE